MFSIRCICSQYGWFWDLPFGACYNCISRCSHCKQGQRPLVQDFSNPIRTSCVLWPHLYCHVEAIVANVSSLAHCEWWPSYLQSVLQQRCHQFPSLRFDHQSSHLLGQHIWRMRIIRPFVCLYKRASIRRSPCKDKRNWTLERGKGFYRRSICHPSFFFRYWHNDIDCNYFCRVILFRKGKFTG